MATKKAKKIIKVKKAALIQNDKLSSVKKSVGKKKIALPKRTPVVLLSDKCEAENKPLKPAFALPSKCAIEKTITVAPPDNLPVEKLISRHSQPLLSARQSFWLGMFFGVTVMGFLVYTFWTLFSADFVVAAVFK